MRSLIIAVILASAASAMALPPKPVGTPAKLPDAGSAVLMLGSVVAGLAVAKRFSGKGR